MTFCFEYIGNFLHSSVFFFSTATCPECRKTILPNKDIIPRLFFNQADADAGELDPAQLKNELEALKLTLRQKDKDKEELRSEIKLKEVCSCTRMTSKRALRPRVRTVCFVRRLCEGAGSLTGNVQALSTGPW